MKNKKISVSNRVLQKPMFVDANAKVSNSAVQWHVKFICIFSGYHDK